MKLFNSFGPNPRVVRMFLLEKGLDLPMVEVDVFGAENRGDGYRSKNPAGQLPALELDDGTVLAETVAICEYLEELYPAPVLIGSTALERAQSRMTIRRIELNVTEYVYNGFRFAEALDLFKDRMRCLPEAADGFKAKARDGFALLDTILGDRLYLGGDGIALGDIILYCCVDFVSALDQALDPALTNLTAWFARMQERPSARASLWGGWDAVGMRG